MYYENVYTKAMKYFQCFLLKINLFSRLLFINLVILYGLTMSTYLPMFSSYFFVHYYRQAKPCLVTYFMRHSSCADTLYNQPTLYTPTRRRRCDRFESRANTAS